MGWESADRSHTSHGRRSRQLWDRSPLVHCEAVIWDEDCETWPDTEGGQLCEMILDESGMTFQNQAALSSTELDNPDPSLLLKL